MPPGPRRALSRLASHPLSRLASHPRVADWSILALVCFEAASGVLSLGAGRESHWPLFVVHGVVGLALTALVLHKLLRVRRRVTDRRLWRPTTALSVLTALLALATFGTGVYWVLGGDARFFAWTTLSVHVGLALFLVPLLVVHVATRTRPLRRAHFDPRRDALRYGALFVAGAAAYRLQSVVNDALDTAGATRRFTGSKPVDGEDFPVTSWVADDPDPVDAEEWSLSVVGEVRDPATVGLDDLDATTERRALLDCTSGWYADRTWRGVRLGDVLDRVGVAADARWVTVVSVTGFRWSFPLEEAREALLATHVEGERLRHGHGFPMRLVAPGRRGFQWVKWVERLEVRRRRDRSQYLAVLLSGFD